MPINDKQRTILLNKLEKLSTSKFRNSFNLQKQDIEYIEKKGISTISKHAKEIIIKRLAPKNIPNDGKQTPMKGHPVFIAQHATATCCRNCLYKWHHIERNRQLTDSEQNYIVALILFWIINQINTRKNNNDH